MLEIGTVLNTDCDPVSIVYRHNSSILAVEGGLEYEYENLEDLLNSIPDGWTYKPHDKQYLSEANK